MRNFGPQWSGDSQILAVTDAPGDYVVLAVPIENAGVHEVSVYLTKADDFGQVRLIVNGEPMGALFDGYNRRVVHSGRLKMGKAYLHEGENRFEFRVLDKDKSSENYYFGVDCFVLKRVSD
jgi:hypothetical protein